MKYVSCRGVLANVLTCISLIFLTACSTMSEYQVGCYDALDQAFNVSYNDKASQEQNDELTNNIENMKISICRSLNAKTRMRYDK